MDFNEIKDIIQINGGKFIIVENGKPTMVIMSFDDFKQNLRKPYQSSLQDFQNQEKDVQTSTEEAQIEKENKLTVEDLPL